MGLRFYSFDFDCWLPYFGVALFDTLIDFLHLDIA